MPTTSPTTRSARWAYAALDPAQRRRHHRAVAHALQRRYAGDPAPVSGQVARHFERAGADEIGHPGTRSTALVFAAMLSLELHDTDGLRHHTAALQALDRAGGVRAAQLTTEALAGYLDVLDGRPETGVAAIETVLEEVQPVDWFADTLVVLFGELRRGIAAQTTDDVHRLTGRDPRGFAEFARDHRAAFLPQPPSMAGHRPAHGRARSG
jgi:hypothetical protein